MRLLVVLLSLLFIKFGVPSYAQSVETAAAAGVGGAASEPDDDSARVNYTPYMFELGREILLNCSSADASPGVSYTWTKNGTAIEQLEDLKDRYEVLEGGAVLRIKRRTHQDDYGLYACHVGGATAHAWRVYGRPITKLWPNANVVEGQKLTLTCKMVGKPYPPVQWMYTPVDSENATAVPVQEVAGSRVTLRDTAAGVPNGELVLENVMRSDAGTYSCVPSGGESLAAKCILHVN